MQFALKLDGRSFRRNRRHLRQYHPPPATHTPEVGVKPSKITVASTSSTEEAVKDSGQPHIQPLQQVSADVFTPPSSPTVAVPTPVKDPTARSSSSD